MPPPRPDMPAPPTVLPFEDADRSAALRRLVPPEVLRRWRAADRTPHAPRLVAVPAPGRAVGEDSVAGAGWAAAALVTARPHTAYLKIVDAVGDVPAAVAAVVSHARDQGLAQVKWEGWTADGEAAAAAGFIPLRPPSVPEADGPAMGYVRWLEDGTVTEPPYYRQTTHFTCGAVAAMVAQAHAGTLPPEALDRPAELTLWRDATNFPACEPVRLGVAVRRTWPDSPVSVLLDTDQPVLLDQFPPEEREWRAVLQRAARADAVRAGVPVGSRGLSIGEIRGAVGRREHVLLLVTLAAMQGFDVPHWVLCHGAVPGSVVIEDSWTHAPAGDTWVDAHLLPVPDRALDRMSVVTPDRFRGAVHLRRPPLDAQASPWASASMSRSTAATAAGHNR